MEEEDDDEEEEEEEEGGELGAWAGARPGLKHRSASTTQSITHTTQTYTALKRCARERGRADGG